MNKLETITELLVNELTDFENNINKLESSLEKAENLKVKFDLVPVQQFINQLDSFQKRENTNREKYVDRLSQRLKQAKIYPKWAVIVFIISIIISFASLSYAYFLFKLERTKKEAAYHQGIQDYKNHINLFFKERPEIEKSYEEWKNEN